MVGKKKSEITDYMMWSKAVTRYAKIFIFGICILVVSFAVGLIVLDKTSVVFLASTIAIVIWCGSAYLILRKMLKAKESLRTAARNVERPEITNPLFKELFDEYEFNQLEGFTQNIFFHAWKLTCVDDYNSIISLCFTKKQHEISIDLSEKEVSIIIDEETDSPVELVMNMHDFNSLDELFNTSILLQRHVEILYQRRINSINRLLSCTLNPLWNLDPPWTRLNPPEGQVNPPPGNSIKTRYFFHKRRVILIEIACLFFMCYDTLQCEAEDLSALPYDYWQAIRIYGDETSYEKEYT